MSLAPSPETVEMQRRAADPAASVWLSANAGSGKTTVLTRRVIRLLLSGADPARILCVTYTKTAAANMQDRIFAELGQWVALDDPGLAARIGDLMGGNPAPSLLARARRLFAEAVETPGGLKIQTIHAFCERLLHLFPFEADVPARFSLMDDVEGGALREAAISDVLDEALANADGPLGRALALVTERVGADALRPLVFEALDCRRSDTDRLEYKFAAGSLRQALGVAPGDSVESVDREILDGGIPKAEWPGLAARMAAQAGAALRAALLAADRDAPRDYCEVFIISTGTPRKTLVVKEVANADAALAHRLASEQERIVALQDRRKRIAAAERTEALFLLADRVLERFEGEKRRRGKLDYADLISRVDQLLADDRAAWVLFKLDQGLDHLLVDEAQDTGPQQWSILRNLTREFFAGAGQRDGVDRSVFAVGDEKQSIFGFQGARPLEFGRTRDAFDRLVTGAGRTFARLELKESFRSTADVLSAVDAVFSAPERFAGLSSDEVATAHGTARGRAPGLVELWPIEQRRPDVETDAWEAVDALDDTAPEMTVARRIARRIASWIGGDARFDHDGRRIAAGDVMILVRRRGAFFDAMIKALKEEGVPVAGADRLTLTDHIAVLDLMAAGRTALMPDDDLALAELLKSPLIGLDDDDLMAITADRGRRSLWKALRNHPADRSQRAAASVARLIVAGRSNDPFRFYAGLLGPAGGRKALLARLGSEAAEAVDVFMATLRQWQAANPPSLLAFLEMLGRAGTEVKRELEDGRGRVRVMTVHGAKGLEAPVVFLADTCGVPAPSHAPKLLPLPGGPHAWSPATATDTPELAAARAEANAAGMGEYRRLLYVAMTRARDRLYVAGFVGTKGPTVGCWYGMIDEALSATGETVDAEDGIGTVIRWAPTPRLPQVRTEETTAGRRQAPLPDWLHRPVPSADRRPPPLRPSHLLDAADGAARPALPPRPDARRRGILIHHLLDRLTGIAVDRRVDLGRRLAAVRFPTFEAAWRDAVVSDAVVLMAEPRFAALFEDGVRIEVDIVGRIGPPDASREVHGRVDRLVVRDHEVIVADFKTGRPPADPERIPDPILDQMAVYRALLGKVYPGRPVRAVIVWTALPRLVSIPDAALDPRPARLMSGLGGRAPASP